MNRGVLARGWEDVEECKSERRRTETDDSVVFDNGSTLHLAREAEGRGRALLHHAPRVVAVQALRGARAVERHAQAAERVVEVPDGGQWRMDNAEWTMPPQLRHSLVCATLSYQSVRAIH